MTTRWTPRQLNADLSLWLTAENVKTEVEEVYGQELTFVKELTDKSGNGNNATNGDKSNRSRPILKDNALNGKPVVSFSDFDLSRVGEIKGTFASNDFSLPDHLVTPHNETLDFSENGASVFVVFKPFLKREIGYRFIRELAKDKYSEKELNDLIVNGLRKLDFPTDTELQTAITNFKNDLVKRNSNPNANSLVGLLPTIYNAPGFQVRLKLDNLYYNSEASNFSTLNKERSYFGLPDLPDDSSDDTTGNSTVDYISGRPNSGAFQVETVSTFGSDFIVKSRRDDVKDQGRFSFSSELEKTQEIANLFESLSIEDGPNYNETWNSTFETFGTTELSVRSNSDFYNPISDSFSILSVVTNQKNGTLDTSNSSITKYDSSTNGGTIFKNGQSFGETDRIIAIPKAERYTSWVHTIGAPLDSITGRVKGDYDNLDFVVSGRDNAVPDTVEAKKVKVAIETAKRYGASGNDENSPDHFAGDIAEIVIFNKELSVSDRQKVEGYLSHKWNLPLVDGHPYKDAAPTFDQSQSTWSPLEVTSLASWIDADNVVKSKASLSRLTNPSFSSRHHYVANEDVRSYFTETEDTSEYVKEYIDKSSFKINFISPASGELSSRTWGLKAAKLLNNEVNSKPSVDFSLAPHTPEQYEFSSTHPAMLKRGYFTNVVETNTRSTIRSGGIQIKGEPLSASYDYPSVVSGQDWLQTKTLLIKDINAAEIVLKYKTELFDVSKFTATVTIASGLGVNYFSEGDLILIRGSDQSQFRNQYDNDGIYVVKSYNNSTGVITLDLFPKYPFAKRQPFGSKTLGFMANSVAIGDVIKINLQTEEKTSPPWFVAKNQEFEKFKTLGGSLFFVLKPDANQTSSKRILLTNGKYSPTGTNEAPIWVTVGGSTANDSSAAVPSQLRLSYTSSSTIQLTGSVVFGVRADGTNLKYYSITFSNGTGTSSTSFDKTGTGNDSSNSYTATIYTGASGITQATVAGYINSLFTGESNFSSSDWNISTVNSQVGGGSNSQVNITATDSGNSLYNFTIISENISNFQVDEADGIAGQSGSESGTSSISINNAGKSGIADSSNYSIIEFVFPGKDEDISSVSSSDAIARWGMWKNAIKQSNQYPNSSTWGGGTDQKSGTIYLNPPISLDTVYGGKLAEVMIFSDDLSVNTRERVEWYLSNKYNIPLPSGHSFSSSDPLTQEDTSWSPALEPDDLFGWYDPSTIEDDGYGNVTWRDQHHIYNSNNNDVRHLNTERNFTQFQPNPVSSEINSSKIAISNKLTANINGLDALRIDQGKALAFYGFLRTLDTDGISVFAVLKYDSSSYSQASDFKSSKSGAIITLSNLFHNESNDSLKSQLYISIADSQSNSTFNNQLETVFEDANSSISDSINTSSSISSAAAIADGQYQILSLISRRKGGTRESSSGFYVDGVSKGSSISTDFDIDAIKIGGGHSIVVSEIILYKKDLSDRARQKVEGYLAEKYNLKSSLGSDHPHKEFGPQKDEALLVTTADVENTTADKWTPLTQENLIGYYTPRNITENFDHSGNSFSLDLSPLSASGAVAGLKGLQDVEIDHKISCSIDDVSYEAEISAETISEDLTKKIVEELMKKITSLTS